MAAILSIQLQENNSVEIRMKGQEFLELPMIGALKLAEEYLMERINKRKSQIEDETCKTKNGIYNSQREKVVGKHEALSHYLDLRSQIENRLQAIATADEKTEFAIDETLPSII